MQWKRKKLTKKGDLVDMGIPDQNIYPSVDINICYLFGDSSFSFLIFLFLFLCLCFSFQLCVFARELKKMLDSFSLSDKVGLLFFQFVFNLVNTPIIWSSNNSILESWRISEANNSTMAVFNFLTLMVWPQVILFSTNWLDIKKNAMNISGTW